MDRPPLPPQHLHLPEEEGDTQESTAPRWRGLLNRKEEKASQRPQMVSEHVENKSNHATPAWKKLIMRIFPGMIDDEPSIQVDSIQVEIADDFVTDAPQSPVERPSTPQTSTSQPVRPDASPLDKYVIELHEDNFQHVIEEQRSTDPYADFAILLRHRQTNAMIAMGVTLLVTLALLLTSGIDYLNTMVDTHRSVEFDTGLGHELARLVSFVAAIVAPVGAMCFLQIAVANLLGGIRERSIAQLIIFTLLLPAIIWTLQQAYDTHYLAACALLVVFGAITWGVRRFTGGTV